MVWSRLVLFGTEAMPSSGILIIISIITLVFLMGTLHFEAYGLEVITNNTAPLGKSNTYWIDKYWNYFLGLSTDEATPKNGGCLINKVDSMVMLMRPIFGGVQNQNCNISSNDTIMMPLWIGWCDSSKSGRYFRSFRKSRSKTDKMRKGGLQFGQYWIGSQSRQCACR
jgi:hypothetical protein